MCLIILSFNVHPTYRLVLAGNRDEYYDRPTSCLSFWPDMPYILAGRDLKSQGTWLGVTLRGRFAAITNYRAPFSQIDDAPSRGLLVSDFLSGNESPKSYLEYIKTVGHRYNGFNLLAGEGSSLFYYSNKKNGIQIIKPGLHGLSNHLLDTSWPKVEKGKADLAGILSAGNELNIEDIFGMLGDRTHPSDTSLPDTGIGLSWERTLSPLFITSKEYGTRSSSILLMERNGNITFWERTFIPKGRGKPKNSKIEQKTQKFCFTI